MSTVTSASVNVLPTDSLKFTVKFTVSAFVGVASASTIPPGSVGAVLSTVYSSSVPGSASTNALPASSVMSVFRLRFSVPSPVTPVTVTSMVAPLAADTLVTAPSAVSVLVSEKSVGSTSLTFSLKVARNTSVSAFVTASVGVCRANDVTVGFSVSTLNSASGGS